MQDCMLLCLEKIVIVPFKFKGPKVPLHGVMLSFASPLHVVQHTLSWPSPVTKLFLTVQLRYFQTKF